LKRICQKIGKKIAAPTAILILAFIRVMNKRPKMPKKRKARI
jgi:hypothetical protein